MTETHEQLPHEESEQPVTMKEILQENWVLRNSLIVFILMLAVPTILAWTLGLFNVSNP